jgi:acetyltransferase
MSTYRLEKLFAPHSVAVIGASPRARSVGRAVLANLRGFAGPVHLVNPRYDQIEGFRAVPSYRDLPAAPDVAVIAVPAALVPDIVAAVAAKGTPSAIIITAGLGHGAGSLAERSAAAARASGLRLVGPNCIGVILPRLSFNASFAASSPRPGDLALISQSGAIATGLIEWAATHGIGFSAIASIGDSIDVDFGDLLDFFAEDRATRAILLYVESIREARKFMSAARAAARAKPVIVVKAGRRAQGAKAAATHTGALAGADAVYDAAFRRAGLLRVFDLDEVFAAAETLGRLGAFSGRRLAILTNGGGIGVLAVDRLADLGGVLADISPATMGKLDAALPPIWSRANPVDIAGDADGARYAAALDCLLDDTGNDAVLVMNVPTALAPAADAARAVIDAVQKRRDRHLPAKPVLAVWIGDSAAAKASFTAAGIPSYATEADAVAGFMHVVRYQETRALVMAAPPSLPEEFTADVEAARAVIDGALRDKRQWLDPIEAARLFSAYGIAVTPAHLARDPDEAVSAAKPYLAAGQAVAVKILSPDILHKSDIGGVMLNLTQERTVHAAAAEILRRARTAKPEARITGVTISPMIVKPKARELIVGLADDPTFGPVIVFGQGGTAVEVINDKALALPPLDLELARSLIARTRVSRILKAYRNVPAADERAIELLLVKLSQLAADCPEIREIDINPVVANETGVIGLDVRVSIAPLEQRPRGPTGHPRFAIRPYPKQWDRRVRLGDGTAVLIRPVRPEDEALYQPFFKAMTADDLRLRFFAPIKEFSHAMIARFTQLDYARAMAFVAIKEATGEMLGVVRLHSDANYERGEYAVLVRSDLKGHGLGWLLMQQIIDYARSEGLRAIEGQVLRENTTMITMCRELGFEVDADVHEADVVVVRRKL